MSYKEIKNKELIEVIRNMSDNRDELKEGDTAYGYWHGEDIFWEFKVERMYPFRNENETGLGFFSEHSCHDIGYAYFACKKELSDEDLRIKLNSIPEHNYFSHPERKEDELYIGNHTDEKFENGIKWKTKRMGETAYDIFNNIVYGLRPVFIRKSEVEEMISNNTLPHNNTTYKKMLGI